MPERLTKYWRFEMSFLLKSGKRMTARQPTMTNAISFKIAEKPIA